MLSEFFVNFTLQGTQQWPEPQFLNRMLKQKMKGIKAANDYERSMKLIRFAVGRGFTLEEVRRFVNQVEPDEYFD